MDSPHFSAGAPPTAGTHATVGRVGDLQWQAVEDGHVVGRADASRRPDGRTFLSIDTWHGAVFDLLATTVPADLAGPLHTMVDEGDHDLTDRWRRAGFTPRRREREYVVGTDRSVAGRAPVDVTILGLGSADASSLGALYDAVRAEVDADAGWDTMPVEVPPRALADPARYAVAVVADRYVGLVRVTSRRHHARIGLVAVRTGLRRRGIARALLAEVLSMLHRNGIPTATAEVDEHNTAAAALFEGIGAQRVGGTLFLERGALLERGV
ncbi:ribosomal-protein-alanine N-acetyltransferase [Pseudonocardia sulfidoxydans NBRC 16205]|uniref:Ribosomal-protein-alanine N-acetyltransferase n=1 Tax=Pseudonocardia sulfidoxydans NBRC 16205 TaxID=1223511 RepID=A0A511DD19_9PSEU|nr:GNAT family N-acetyltransferase [Pseudonocardia sulfidoxydans]GEL22700.1 ribosomal-protein-alanine N-acetyltransferase [Pseudonocardia sulfidoxydans NBRC 16205]